MVIIAVAFIKIAIVETTIVANFLAKNAYLKTTLEKVIASGYV